MISININKIPCTSIDLTLVQNGVWNANVVVPIKDATNKFTVGDTITITIDLINFLGSISMISTAIPGIVKLSIIGGKGNLILPIASKQFNGASVNAIVIDMLKSEYGFSSELSDSDATRKIYRSWCIVNNQYMSKELTRLAYSIGCVWRLDESTGKVIFIKDTFVNDVKLPTNAIVELIGNDAQSIRYGFPKLDFLPKLGTKIGQIKIRQININANATRTTITLLNNSLSDIINTTNVNIANRLFPATVVSMNSDGSFVLNPDDIEIKGFGLDYVRFRGGASTSWIISKGARVLIQFDNNDISRPFIISIEGFWSGDFLTNVIYGDPAIAQFLSRDDKIQIELNVLKQKFDDLKTLYNAHIHGTGVGPSAPPTTPSTIAYSPGNTACVLIKSV